jgi:hypothetical protein
VAQVKGRTIGSFETDHDAAKALVKVLRVKSAKILRKRKCEGSLKEFRDRFKALQKLFIPRGKHILPADAAATQRQYATKATMAAFKAEPFLEDLCLVVKYGPIKDAIMQD